MKIYRHGDVLLRQIGKLPGGLEGKKLKGCVLAKGEYTGHSHELEAFQKGWVQWFPDVDPGVKSYLVVKGGIARLKHQEHNSIDIEGGIYEVTKEREFDYFSEMVQRVRD